MANRELKLLPSNASSFSSSDYWDSFFSERKSEFEWYGEYDELAPLLHKFCSPKDSMLIVGCGSSNLSERLYSDGFQTQLNIDISSVIINRMQTLYPHLVFKEDDVTGLDCAVGKDGEFSCVLDKGTFDALAPPPPKSSNTSPTAEEASKTELMKPTKMLNEVQRVLKKAGRFVCISLLQSHVAEILLGYFVKLGWIIKINRCEAAEKYETSQHQLPVYVCMFMKPVIGSLPRIQTETIIEFVGVENGGKAQRLKTAAEVLSCLKMEMTNKFYAAALKTIGHFAQEQSEWMLSEENGQIKYTLYAVDVMALVKNSIEKQMIIFIIPQGREMEFLFGTHEGRTILAKQMGYTRAIFVALQRNREYTCMTGVQTEVGNCVHFLTPKPVVDANVKIPVVTVGNDLGSRKVIHCGKSDFSGDYSVEDVQVGRNVLRRLIFLNAPNVIQSEVALKVTMTKQMGKGARNVSKTPVPYQLTSDYHGIMSLAVPMLRFFMRKDENLATDGLLIGMGGGLLVSFLLKYFPLLRLTALELDPEIVTIAKNYFGLEQPGGENERLRIVVQDGLKFIKETASKFDLIFFDVDNKSATSGLSCPPHEFLTPETLQVTKKGLTPEGIFVLNFVCRKMSLEEQYVATLSSTFPFIYKVKLAKEVNTVFLCFPKTPPGNSKLFAKSLLKSVQHVRDVQVRLRGSLKWVELESPTEDNIVSLIEDAGVEDLCSRFKILKTYAQKL